MRIKYGVLIGALGITTLSSPLMWAQEAGTSNTTNKIIFTAPPREAAQQSEDVYRPVAQYLTQVLGKEVIYEHPGSWATFWANTKKGKYDLVFDSAHLNSYRAKKLNHTVLAKAAHETEFVVVVNKDAKHNKLDKLAGRSICAYAPPELSTLMVLAEFKNPSRQPRIVNTESWDTIYNKVKSGSCQAGILPSRIFTKLDPNHDYTVAVYSTGPIQNQAFSASPRITKADQAKIIKALTSDRARIPTAHLRNAFLMEEGFVPASNNEYVGLARYVEDEMGYY